VVEVREELLYIYITYIYIYIYIYMYIHISTFEFPKALWEDEFPKALREVGRVLKSTIRCRVNSAHVRQSRPSGKSL